MVDHGAPPSNTLVTRSKCRQYGSLGSCDGQLPRRQLASSGVLQQATMDAPTIWNLAMVDDRIRHKNSLGNVLQYTGEIPTLLGCQECNLPLPSPHKSAVRGAPVAPPDPGSRDARYTYPVDPAHN